MNLVSAIRWAGVGWGFIPIAHEFPSPKSFCDPRLNFEQSLGRLFFVRIICLG